MKPIKLSEDLLIEEYKQFMLSYRRKGLLFSETRVGPLTKAEEKTYFSKFAALIEKLQEMNQYDVVLLSIGSARGKQPQQFPKYLKEFKKPNKILILTVDAEFIIDWIKDELYTGSEADKNELDLTYELFECFFPWVGCIRFAEFMEKQLSVAMDKGTLIYIANHTQSYSLQDISLVAEVYNNVKQTHSSPHLLQLYSQGGARSVVTYYAELLYDKRSELDNRDTGSKKSADKGGIPFYSHPHINRLQELKQFNPRIKEEKSRPQNQEIKITPQKRKPKPQEKEIVQIYQALYHGETAFFKGSPTRINSWSFMDMKEHVYTSPKGRTAAALEIHKNWYDKSPGQERNAQLFKAVHEQCLARSGFFAKTNNGESEIKNANGERSQIILEYLKPLLSKSE